MHIQLYNKYFMYFNLTNTSGTTLHVYWYTCNCTIRVRCYLALLSEVHATNPEGLKLYGIYVHSNLVTGRARRYWLKLPATWVTNMQFYLMKLSQAVAVSDAQNCYVELRAHRIQVSLHCDTHLTRRLIQNCSIVDRSTVNNQRCRINGLMNALTH